MPQLLSWVCRECEKEVAEPSSWRFADSCLVCQSSAKWCLLIPNDCPEEVSSDEAIRQVWFQLAGHDDNGYSPVDTLNRLLRKHLCSRGEKRAAPTLSEDDVKASLVWWTTQKLDSLWRGHECVEWRNPQMNPRFIDLPVLVLRLKTIDCVIDGTTRINRRISDGGAGPHPVYLLAVSA